MSALPNSSAPPVSVDASSDVDPLLVLHDALIAAGREPTLDARLGVLASALATLGNGPATVVMRDASLDAVHAARAVPGAAPELWDAGSHPARAGEEGAGFAGA